VFVGAVNLLFTIVAMTLVDKAGRKPLLIVGSLGMGVSLVAMGAAAVHSRTGLWLLAFVPGYIACFTLLVGLVTWVALSELFPRARKRTRHGLSSSLPSSAPWRRGLSGNSFLKLKNRFLEEISAWWSPN
jgi:MFS family permease